MVTAIEKSKLGLSQSLIFDKVAKYIINVVTLGHLEVNT